MLNQLLKFTLVSSLLLWLKPRWKGMLALIVAVVLVHVVHGEYLGYVELSQDQTFLIWSYILKWFLLLAAVGIYLLLSLSGSPKPAPGARKARATREAGPKAGDPGPPDDGFDFLREKKALKSRADMVIASPGDKGRVTDFPRARS